MSAQRLREAAARMREDAAKVCRPYGRDEYFVIAVADWLDFEARAAEKAAEQYPSDIWDVDEHALAVADAYLGSPS